MTANINFFALRFPRCCTASFARQSTTWSQSRQWCQDRDVPHAMSHTSCTAMPEAIQRQAAHTESHACCSAPHVGPYTLACSSVHQALRHKSLSARRSHHAACVSGCHPELSCLSSEKLLKSRSARKVSLETKFSREAFVSRLASTQQSWII